MNSVQSATEQQEQIGSFKRRLRKRRNVSVIDALGNTGLTTLLQKSYIKQFYFEKRVGSGGAANHEKQQPQQQKQLFSVGQFG
ncbi:GH23946 [Drosophila grimshawi]|uniref:GH23946 n=1 Tax=Drosophila grimshawi TaxID=7222 RepID=B4JZS5_DROGR|nr:GH23946 [Drosophila grimshawi]